MVIGRVVNAVIDEDYANGIDKKYQEDGFMFNVHSPRFIATGEEDQSGIATLQVNRRV